MKNLAFLLAWALLASCVALGCAADSTCPAGTRFQNGGCYRLPSDGGPRDAGDGAVPGACTVGENTYIETRSSEYYEALESCTLSCGLMVDFRSCMVPCMQTRASFSGACAGCSSDYALCLLSSCFNECTNTQSRESCAACLCTRGCVGALDACTGGALGEQCGS